MGFIVVTVLRAFAENASLHKGSMPHIEQAFDKQENRFFSFSKGKKNVIPLGTAMKNRLDNNTTMNFLFPRVLGKKWGFHAVIDYCVPPPPVFHFKFRN